MGGSQCKFTPKPKDAWRKILTMEKEPKYLLSVLQAIIDLKESTGSSAGRIIDYLRHTANQLELKPKSRNLAMEVKRALQYAVIHRLVKQRGGKFTIALNGKDFDIFKGSHSKNLSKKHEKKDEKIKKEKTQNEPEILTVKNNPKMDKEVIQNNTDKLIENKNCYNNKKLQDNRDKNKNKNKQEKKIDKLKKSQRK